MSFSVIKTSVIESYGDSAWSKHYCVDTNLEDGRIILKDKDNFEFNQKYDYEIELNYYEDQQGYNTIKQEPEEKDGCLFFPHEVLKFLKIHLLKDTLETNLVIKNNKIKKLKI